MPPGSGLPRLLAIGALMLALLCSSIAWAGNPMFEDLIARTSFLRTENGRRIIRSVVPGLPQQLNRSHYMMFLARLGTREHRALEERLQLHLATIMEAVMKKRGDAPAPAEGSFQQQLETRLIIELAEEHLWDPTVRDLAEMNEGPQPPIRAAAAPKGRSLRRSPMRPSAASAALESPFVMESVAAPVPQIPLSGSIPPETIELDLYPSSLGMRRQYFERARHLKRFLGIFTRDLIDLRYRDRNAPWTLRSDQGRVADRDFYYSVRAYVRLFDGYNEYFRDQFLIELFANIERPAFARLVEASRDDIRKYAQGETKPAALIESMKADAKKEGLNLPEVTWLALERMLYVIARMRFLCGWVEDGVVTQGEISELTRNLKRQQAGMAELESGLATLEKDLAQARADKHRAGVTRVQQMLVAQKGKIALARQKILQNIDLLAELYADVVNLRMRVLLFNNLREGLMNKGLTTETVVGALDMPDITVVPDEVHEIWKTFEEYGIGRMVTAPGDPDYVLPNISGRVIPILIKGELQVLIGRFRGENQRLAGQLEKLSKEAAGTPIKQRMSMYQLAEFVEATSKRILVVRGALGVVGLGGSYLFSDPVITFVQGCWNALMPGG